MNTNESSTLGIAPVSASAERDQTDGITPEVMPPAAPGWSMTSVYSYGYEDRATSGALINADAYDAAEHEVLEGADVNVFVHSCKGCDEERLVVRGDYDNGSARLFAFEHAPGSEWRHAPVPGAIAVAHAAVRAGPVETPFGVIGRDHDHED